MLTFWILDTDIFFENMHRFKFHSELKMWNNPIRLYIAFLLPQRKKKTNTNIKTYPQQH